MLSLIAFITLCNASVGAHEGGDAISAIALRIPTGQYWSVSDGDGSVAQMFADQWAIGPTETFYLEEMDSLASAGPGCLLNGARVRLFTADRGHWTVLGTEVLVSTSEPQDSSSVFTLINETAPDRCFQYGDHLSLVSADKLYLSASPGGIVDADQKRPGDWEIFVLVDPSSSSPVAPSAQFGR